MAEVVENLSSTCKAFSSNPSTAKPNKQKPKKKSSRDGSQLVEKRMG
jgi:hypothetical protein